MPGVFISYRRDDSSQVVERLQEVLRNIYADLEIFVDTEVIKPGEDFPKVLQHHSEQDLVFLAVIGRKWQGDPDGKFATRLQDPDDWVRREVGEATVVLIFSTEFDSAWHLWAICRVHSLPQNRMASADAIF